MANQSRSAIQRKLMGLDDPRGPVGMFSRGKNIYGGVSTAAHKGGGHQYGRPKKTAIQRRLSKNKRKQ